MKNTQVFIFKLVLFYCRTRACLDRAGDPMTDLTLCPRSSVANVDIRNCPCGGDDGRSSNNNSTQRLPYFSALRAEAEAEGEEGARSVDDGRGGESRMWRRRIAN